MTVAFIGSSIYMVGPLSVELLKKDLEEWLILEEVSNLGWVLRFERLMPAQCHSLPPAHGLRCKLSAAALAPCLSTCFYALGHDGYALNL